jgi:hypothetical protein
VVERVSTGCSPPRIDLQPLGREMLATAARMAAAVSSDPDTALRAHTREELGVDPFELPSPLVAGPSA